MCYNGLTVSDRLHIICGICKQTIRGLPRWLEYNEMKGAFKAKAPSIGLAFWIASDEALRALR